ncbi:hypothetical protein [Streptomyces sp. NRRL S-1831]|uniref:hypothetical protein n=1 Tax=Streptomyces sp. NRRL S-1831 TaxID=1463890 RepID=UPI001F27B08E|nr:hypothetical protein [Streptomyces sp. NRRL S-1831]
MAGSAGSPGTVATAPRVTSTREPSVSRIRSSAQQAASNGLLVGGASCTLSVGEVVVSPVTGCQSTA